jgi:hypothetical protein
MDLLRASANVLAEAKLGDGAFYSAASKDLVRIFSALYPKNLSDEDWMKFSGDFQNSSYKTDKEGMEYLELPKSKVKIYLSNKQPSGVSGRHLKVMKDLSSSWHIFS